MHPSRRSAVNLKHSCLAATGERCRSATQYRSRLKAICNSHFIGEYIHGLRTNTAWLFAESTTDVRETLDKLGATRRELATEYRRLVDELGAFRGQHTLCTVYDSVLGLGDAELAGLCVFNDAISRTAFAVNATLTDLRNICDQSTDYAGISSIEPSASGGAKIARAIMHAALNGGVTRKVIA